MGRKGKGMARTGLRRKGREREMEMGRLGRREALRRKETLMNQGHAWGKGL